MSGLDRVESPRDMQIIVLENSYENGRITKDHYYGMMFDLFEMGHLNIERIYKMFSGAIKDKYKIDEKWNEILGDMQKGAVKVPTSEDGVFKVFEIDKEGNYFMDIYNLTGEEE